MTLTEVLEAIEEDSKLDMSYLEHESIKIPELHAKWYRRLAIEIVNLKKVQRECGKIVKERTEYFLGRAKDEEYESEPLNIKVVQKDLPLYLDADDKYCEAKLKEDMQVLKVNAIESFLKEINQRSFNIRNALEAIRFKAGLN